MNWSNLSLTILLLAGCSSVEVYEHAAWPQYAYPGFSEKIDRIAGARAIDCGFYDLKGRDSKAHRGMEKGFSDCVKKLIEEGKPFKVGSVRIPVDSYAYEILVYSAEKEYWIIVFDLMLDGSDAAHWVKRCESVKIKSQDLDYEGVGCRDVSNEEWMADIEG